ncbi:hypothetical protein K503DRAFT_776013 [Rhizopogon vinicolor AM-OR11-026]|uniref:ATPase AAA-type core domain-containing protein n=1 Tax=Rhizopogon vinicolor AM-OR11-026 TaxID=1314800 RepID=A0A1B7MKB7_9AGAM|nr:hypothetical protein K503DRAFT_776013 [Rhizopogon vinicolor AM-OR11-026]
MSKKFNVEEQPERALPSAEITEPTPIREADSESACPETSTASLLRTKEASISVPASSTSSSGFLRWIWLPKGWKFFHATTKSSYFNVNARRKKDKEEPNVVLSDFSPILLTCLRIVVGGACLSKHAEVPIHSLFLELDALETHTNAARSALVKDNDEDLDGVVRSAKALGHEGLDADGARKYLAAAVQQLESLLLFLKEEFKPVAERLKHAIPHGYIPRDLQEFYYPKGQKYYYLDDSGDFEAFRLMSTRYNPSKQTFVLDGEKSYWDGTKWVKEDIERTLSLYEGSLVLDGLPITKMTHEICVRLTERARKYISLAGVHLRLYRGRRIVVDRLAWNTFGYSHAGVSGFSFPLLQDRSTARTNDNIPPAPEEDIDLFPRVLPGFDLEREVWEFFDVDEVMPIKFNDQAWKHIVLEESSKSIIEEVVGAYDFRKKEMSGEEEMGLVIFLHGPSGTGKTATVGAIAEHFRRPIYPLAVNMNTLPVDTTLLRHTLTSRLEMAKTWNAIILIEAGDVLLQTYNNNPMMDEYVRISTILEFFQYHRCIVFVTARNTCPIYVSHFSLTIQYHELDPDSRQILWSNMLSGEGDNISHRDIEELSRVAVNGRAMRSIRITAKALARSSKQSLSLHHLKTAAKRHGQVEGEGYHLYW